MVGSLESKQLQSWIAILLSIVAYGTVFGADAQFDERCHHFGIRNEKSQSIPVAFSGIENIASGSGTLGFRKLSDSIRKMIEVAGLFYLVPQEYYPANGFLEGTDPLSIDFHGWCRSGAAALVKATLKEYNDGYTSVGLFFYLNEEGVLIKLPGIAEKVKNEAIWGKINRWFNNLIYCLTGMPGIFGTRITYSVRGDGTAKEIGVVEIGSGNGKRLTSDGSISILPSWSPEGEIIYTSYKSGSPAIYRAGKLFISYGEMVYGAQFSPDGKNIAATVIKEGNADICLFHGVTGEFHRCLTEEGSIDTGAVWSPDGKSIAFVSDRDGSPQIYVIDVNGEGIRRITYTGSYNTAPDWSPAGNEIAFSSRIGGERSAIFKINTFTLETKQLTPGIFTDEEPSYSPDGRFIAFTSNRTGKKQIYVMTREGRNIRLLTDDKYEYFTPSWERFFVGAAQ